MLHRDYEEQYFDNLDVITRRGYRLRDMKVSLDRRLRVDLNDELPLLRSSYVSIPEVTKTFYILMKTIDIDGVLKDMKTVRHKPISLFTSSYGLIRNVSCVIDVDNKVTFSVVMGYVDWVKELPVVIPAFALMCQWLIKYSELEAGQLHVLSQFATLTSKTQKLRKLWSNHCVLSSCDHPYKRYAIVHDWIGTESDYLVDILNYSVDKTAYPTVEKYNIMEVKDVD